ncbi:MAG: hypothetical protein AAF216_06995 [Pseudomonadota bacterium]
MAKKALLTVLAALPLIAACNTIDGIGQDVQAVGTGVSSAANYVERQMFSPRGDEVQTASVVYREPSVTVGQACDSSRDPDSRTGLPPCPTTSRMVVQNRSMSSQPTRTQSVTTTRSSVTTMGTRACDPGGELKGDSGLPPCQISVTTAR